MNSGLQYKEFCIFAKEKFKLTARPVSILTLNQIKYEISKKNFVIISVHPDIRHPESVPPSQGGHLVLVVGYDDQKQGVYIHNPSGYESNNSQSNAFISYKNFHKFFANRGIVINSA